MVLYESPPAPVCVCVWSVCVVCVWSVCGVCVSPPPPRAAGRRPPLLMYTPTHTSAADRGYKSNTLLHHIMQ